MSAAFRLKADLDDPRVDLLWQAGCTGVMQSGDEVVAFFPEQVSLTVTGRWEEVDQVDYVAAYLAGLEPVVLGRLTVAPLHYEVAEEAGRIVLRLDPGMAFGTGHHESTRLALGALERADLRGQRVLDVGTGSGILAIAAGLLGAAEVTGIDSDATTSEIAQKNAELNEVRAVFATSSIEAWREGEYDVIVANLYGAIHTRLAPIYGGLLADGGRLYATGILEGELDHVRRKLSRHLDVYACAREGDWALLSARRLSPVPSRPGRAGP